MKRITRASVAARAAAAKKTIVTTTTSTPPRTRRISPVPAMTPSVVLSSPVVRTGTTKTTVVTPSPRPQKRKCPDNNTEAFIEKKKAPLFSKPAAVPSSAEAATTTTTTIRRDTIRRLVESSVLDGICESCNDDTTTAAVDTEEIKIKGDDSNINHTNNTTVDMRTLGGWCLVDALFHCANASDAILAPLILKHGPPSFYLDYLRKQTEATKKTSPRITSYEEYPSFLSLCRTVAGQQLAGAAAETIWRRLVGVVVGTTAEIETAGVYAFSTPSLQAFTPRALLAVVENQTADENKNKDNNATIVIDTELLRKPAGLSNTKCNCIVAIARCFEAGTLSEAFLMPDTTFEDEHNIKADNTEEVRSRLLSIKGIGPWSVDMFLMFRCHRSNVLPIGDLAVRNGTAALWGKVDAKKDTAAVTELHAPFEPYRSVSSYYMYKITDDMKKKKKPKTMKKPKK